MGIHATMFSKVSSLPEHHGDKDVLKYLDGWKQRVNLQQLRPILKVNRKMNTSNNCSKTSESQWFEWLSIVTV